MYSHNVNSKLVCSVLTAVCSLRDYLMIPVLKFYS